MIIYPRKYIYQLIFTASLATIGLLVRRAYFTPILPWWIDIVVWFLTFLILNGIVSFFANLNRWLDKYIPFDKNTPLRVALQLTVGMILILTVRMIGAYFIRKNIPTLQSETVNQAILVADIFMAAAVNLGVMSNYLIRKWKETLLKTEKLEREKIEMQYHQLKNQVNPHFLFNSFSTLQGLIQTNTADALKYVNHLSKVYRYIMQHPENAIAPLTEEIQLAKSYQEILGIRYENALILKLPENKELTDAKIPVATIIMLIDNAIKHNEIHPAKPLNIDIILNDDYLIVQNNLQTRPSLIESSKKGLHQLVSLYGILSEKSVIIEKTETEFKVSIPLLKD